MRAHLKVAFVPTMLIMAAAAPVSPGAYSLTITPTASEVMRFDRGISSVDSAQKSTTVRVVNVAGNDKKSVSFVIGVVNSAGASFNFGPENIVVRPSGMQPIALTTYEQAMVAEQKKQSREKFWAGVGAFGRGLSAANAGTTYSSGLYSGTTSGYVGNTLVTAQTNGIYSGTQYNPGAALAAQRQARELNAADRANLEARWASRSSMYGSLLRTTTVDRGMMYGGVATFPITPEIKKSKQPVQITIEVTVGGEKHIFVGQLAKAS